MKKNLSSQNFTKPEPDSAKTAANPHTRHRERMRARFLDAGAEILQDHELLEMLLYYAIPRRDTNPIAHRLIERFGRLDKLFAASAAELMQVDGIGENAAVLLKTVFECHRRISSACDPNEMFHSFEQIGDYLVKLYTGVETERLMLLLLDKKAVLTAASLFRTARTTLHRSKPKRSWQAPYPHRRPMRFWRIIIPAARLRRRMRIKA